MDARSIAADIRRRIISGEYPYGSRLPSVRDQVQHYGASQQTVSAAYASLAALGLVRTERTSGTVVTAARRSDAHLGTFAPPDLTAASAWQPTGDGQAREEVTLVRQITAPASMAEWGIPTGRSVVERTRMRYIDDIPVQHKITVMPYALAAKAPAGHEGIPPMLAPAGTDGPSAPAGMRMADWLGWDVAHTESVITVEPMDDAASEALGVAAGSPAFRVVGVARGSEGATVYVTVTTAQIHHRITLTIVG
ncbi:GntR family transcriptional regulator [Streptomyces qinzhouensis]|uniref:GntR family transcriptional regulator n=1 Tax=Streptomyces qinzhouensis TaxID=2599401 RepID=UPI001644B395|nr:GntR family transcriptional regulator [Streptomyces qinzhouensis]